MEKRTLTPRPWFLDYDNGGLIIRSDAPAQEGYSSVFSNQAVVARLAPIGAVTQEDINNAKLMVEAVNEFNK